MSTLLERLIRRLTTWQTNRPVLVLLVALATIVPAALLAKRLELRTGFNELLPDNAPSVIELRRLGSRLPSMSTLAVTIESHKPELVKQVIDELVPKLRAFPDELVASVEDGPREAQAFFERHKHFYASIEDIRELHEEVISRYDWEVGKRLGTNIDDEEPAPLTAEVVEQRFKKSLEDARSSSPGTDGYWIGEEQRFGVVLVRTPLTAMDQRAFELTERITEILESANYRQIDPEFRYGFTGNLITSAEEYRAVVEDLTEIGLTGIALVLMVVFFFFWRIRVLIAMGVSICVGCLWCFAFAELAIGHLNTATGFLVSVIAGNGINAMIIYMARFLEARRDQGMNLGEALYTATRDTYVATFAAVGVAMVAYGALMITEFRGFRHFGVIGAAGMFLCWVSTYTVLPAVLSLLERIRPFPPERTWRDRMAALYGKPFIWLAKRYSRPVAAFGLMSAIAGATATFAYFSNDSMEYDLRKIRNDFGEPTSARALSARMNKVIPSVNEGGRAILTDHLEQVQPLVAELERRRDEAPEKQKPFGKVVSIYSLLPSDQEEKAELLTEILDRIQRARDRGFLSDEEWQRIEPHLPKEIVPIGIDDLPELVARPFQEKDGTRGKIVYVAPTPGRSVNDARYLLIWADALREVRLPDGAVIRSSGDAVVFADMLLSIDRDAPLAALLSFLGTMCVILLTFRGRAGGWVAVATLMLGLSWTIGMLYVLDVKLNFLNFVALPIAIGVGSDYAINVLKRRELEGDAGIERAFVETGGAVVACSMATLSGYTALLFSVNGAVRSLGLTAGLGEICTQLSAMLVLPAVLYSVADRRRAREVVAAQPLRPAE